MRKSCHAVVVFLFLVSSVTGQNLVVSDVAGGMFFEQAGVTPLYPGGGPQLAMWPQMPPLPPAIAGPGGLVVPPGACTLDGTNGLTWYSNGPLIAAVPHGAYPGLSAPIAPFPAPPFPPPGGPILIPAGFVSGMAIDPVGGILWVTNGFTVLGMLPAPGGPVVVPPFVPGFPGPIGLLTGLDWDPITGTLWACDAAGVLYNFLPGGAPVAAPIPPVAPLPPPVTGVTIDKSGLPFGAGRPLYTVGAGLVLENLNGIMMPNPAAAPVGLTYHPAPQPSLPGACACPTFTPGSRLLGPASNTNPFFGIDWVNLPPNQTVVMGIDVVFNPAFPMINVVGCPLGLFPFSPSLILLPGASDATGTFSFPVSLVGVPPGVTFYFQYATGCPGDPTGIILSPMYQLIVSAP